MSESHKMRSLDTIAREILRKWPNMNYAARPYVRAMLHLNSIKDTYITESADDIVTRFLSNASTWQGEDARRIKKELREMQSETD